MTASQIHKDFIVSSETKGLKNVVLTVVGVRSTSTAVSGENPVIQEPRCRSRSSRGPDQAITVVAGPDTTVNLNVGK